MKALTHFCLALCFATSDHVTRSPRSDTRRVLLLGFICLLSLFHAKPNQARAEVELIPIGATNLYQAAVTVNGVVYNLPGVITADMMAALPNGAPCLNISGLQWLTRMASRFPQCANAIGSYIEQVIAAESAAAGDAGAGAFMVMDAGLVFALAFAAAVLTGKYVLPQAVASVAPTIWNQWINGATALPVALATSVQNINAIATGGASCFSCVSAILGALPQPSVLSPIVNGCNSADPDSLDAKNCALFVQSVNSALLSCSGGTSAMGSYYTSVNVLPDPAFSATQICQTPTATQTPLPVAANPKLSCPMTGNSSTGGTKYLYSGDICDPTNQQKMIDNQVYCDVNNNLPCTKTDLAAVCSCTQQACNVNTPLGQAVCTGSDNASSLLKQAYYSSSYCDKVLGAYYGNSYSTFGSSLSFGGMCCPCGQTPVGPGACSPQAQRCVAASTTATFPAPIYSTTSGALSP